MRLKGALPVAGCVLALSGIAACGTTDGPAAPGPAASASVVQRMDVKVSGTTVTPAPSQVELAVGQTLELTVTTDHDDELHAHGFDGANAELKAGEPTTVRLTATESGVFEVETHDPALTLLTVAVR